MLPNRLRLVLIAVPLIVVLAACAGVTPPTPLEQPTTVEPPTVAVATEAPTTAPTGEVATGTMWCQWAGLGATVAAGEKRLNFSCDTGDPARQVGLFGDIENTDQGWMIAAAPVTVAATGPAAGQIQMVTVDYIQLEDGTKCANAGHGATTGFDDKRLNYTCEVASGEQTGLFGDVEATDAGWTITKAAFNISAGGPTVTTPTMFTIKALGVPPLSAVQ